MERSDTDGRANMNYIETEGEDMYKLKKQLPLFSGSSDWRWPYSTQPMGMYMSFGALVNNNFLSNRDCYPVAYPIYVRLKRGWLIPGWNAPNDYIVTDGIIWTGRSAAFC
ncbi:MAG: hypothetical protein WC762_03195 [Methylobacter sp.]